MIQSTRIKLLNDKPVQPGSFVLYWMQQSQRAEYNQALEVAIQQANALELPVVVLFGITDGYPEANERHYAFMLEGLAEVSRALTLRAIPFVVRKQSPELAAVEMAASAAILVVDRGYLRLQRQWRAYVAEHAPCQVMQVEADVIVPVETASNKEEYGARTLRPKIHKLLEEYLVPMEETELVCPYAGPAFDGLNIEDVDKVLASLDIDRTVPRVSAFRGGTQEAKRHLEDFIANRASNYDTGRNDPAQNGQSNMSAYLHFGQISPLYVALQIAAVHHDDGADAYLEEMIVRRELSMNFVTYSPSYDTIACLPEWALKTLKAHEKDPHPVQYSLSELESAQTDDIYWNAAQTEMLRTGKMHGYMRMYWGKKVLEWSATAEEGFNTLLHLNNKYFLCGRDANAYANVAWCFGKFDRPWALRPIFGNVRYMNANGLKHKFDMAGYLTRVNKMAEPRRS